MAILRALDRIFGSLDLAQRYARAFALGDADLAARGLTRDELGRLYLEDLAALDAATAASRPATVGRRAPA